MFSEIATELVNIQEKISDLELEISKINLALDVITELMRDIVESGKGSKNA
jgi:hypothetical protein